MSFEGGGIPKNKLDTFGFNPNGKSSGSRGPENRHNRGKKNKGKQKKGGGGSQPEQVRKPRSLESAITSCTAQMRHALGNTMSKNAGVLQIEFNFIVDTSKEPETIILLNVARIDCTKSADIPALAKQVGERIANEVNRRPDEKIRLFVELEKTNIFRIGTKEEAEYAQKNHLMQNETVHKALGDEDLLPQPKKSPILAKLRSWGLGGKKETEKINLDTPQARAKVIAELMKLRGETAAKQEEIVRLRDEEGSEIKRLAGALDEAKKSGGKGIAETQRLTREIAQMKTDHERAIAKQATEMSALKTRTSQLEQSLADERRRVEEEQRRHAESKLSLAALAELGLKTDAETAKAIADLPRLRSIAERYGDSEITQQVLRDEAVKAAQAAERERLNANTARAEIAKLSPIAARVPELEQALKRLQTTDQAHAASGAESSREREGLSSQLRDAGEAAAREREAQKERAADLAKMSAIIRAEVVPFLKSNSDKETRALAEFLDTLHKYIENGTQNGVSDLKEALAYAETLQSAKDTVPDVADTKEEAADEKKEEPEK